MNLKSEKNVATILNDYSKKKKQGNLSILQQYGTVLKIIWQMTMFLQLYFHQ